MFKRSLPFYFISISLLTAVITVTTGLLLSFLERNYSFGGLYYLNKRISSNLYLQMMDKEIPGNVVNKQGDDHFSDLLNPIALLNAELPGLKRFVQQSEESSTVQNEEVPVPAVPVSALPDQPPQRMSTATTSQRPAVFVYQTHNRESWVSEVEGSSTGDVQHPTRNITLVGRHFADQLEKIGIPVFYDQTDHTGILRKNDQKYSLSYAVSAQTVAAAQKEHPQIEYIFDFHRDSLGRKNTTVTIDGEDYAKIMFVIGKHNEHWEENLAFAERLQELLEKKYPGLCRPIAVYPKGSSHNGEYNQSLSPNALTVEIGGRENTLEESNRTVELLADAFAEIYLEAVPVFNQEGGNVE
jgi:stage II sporulation protein P